MTTSRVDALVAGLAGVDDDRLPGPSTPGAGELLTAITAEERPASPTGRPSRRYGRFAIGVVAVAAVSAVVALNTGGPGPIRGYANAAVDIRRTDGTYKVHVKNVYADQRQFRQAFAEFGLDVTLSIVPVSPGHERQILGGRDDGPNGTSRVITVLDCPRAQATACPLTVELSGAVTRGGSSTIIIGRTARPGETYWDHHPRAGDNPASLRLTGRSVTDALALLRRRNLTPFYVLGQQNPDGTGSWYNPPPTWRPDGDRHVTGAWNHSSRSIGLLVTAVKGDPGPVPVADSFPD